MRTSAADAARGLVDVEALRALADHVLARNGGRYWAGLHRRADLP